MSYEYDSGFGYVPPPVGADLTKYVLAPKCIIENAVADVSSIWPKFYWSTFVSGPYASGAVSKWLRSIGCDPISLVEPAGSGIWPHTCQISDGLDEYGIPIRSSFGLSSDLLFDLNRMTIPEGIDVQEWQRAQIDVNNAIKSKDEEWLQGWAKSAKLIINGYKHGLCIFPPAQFHNQEHLDAWAAHYLEWRYGWDSEGGKGGFRKGVASPYPSANPNLYQRAIYAGWECADPLVYMAKCGTAISRLWDQTVKYWDPVTKEESFVNGGFVQKPEFSYRKFFKLNLDDKELGSKFIVLQTLLNIQLAYYAEARGVSSAFPGADNLPHIDIGVGDVVASFLQSLSSLAISFMASGGIASGATSIGKVVQGVVQTQTGNILKAAADASKPLANLPLPSHEMWRPIPVHISHFTDGPQCQAAPLPQAKLVNPDLVRQVLASQLPTAKLKLSTNQIEQILKAKQGSPWLLPALGIGGALLLMKLLKKG